MADHPSALKRARQNVKRRLRNRFVVSTFRTVIKKLRTAVESNDTATAEEQLLVATRLLSKAAAKGVIHKNQASRKIGRLTVAVNALKKG